MTTTFAHFARGPALVLALALASPGLAQTAAGTSATQAMGIQGVTGGVPVPVSGTFWQATQPVSLASLPAISCVYDSSLPTLTSGQGVAVQCDSNGRQLVTVANANANGQQPMANSSPVVIANNQSNVPVAAQLQTSGGLTYKMLNALANTAVTIKGSAGQLMMLQCGNTNSSEEYVQVYDATSATPGTTTPKLSVPIAATSAGGFTLSLVGIQFTSGIIVAAATTATGGTAPSTALDCNAAYN